TEARADVGEQGIHVIEAVLLKADQKELADGDQRPAFAAFAHQGGEQLGGLVEAIELDETEAGLAAGLVLDGGSGSGLGLVLEEGERIAELALVEEVVGA